MITENNKEDIHFIRDVPFFPDENRFCGPSSLASIFHFWDVPIPVRDIAEKVYLPKIRGTLNIDMEIYARGAGFDTKSYKGSLDDIRGQVSKGRPLIAFINLGYKIFPIGHYIVIIGYNDKERYIIAHSGKDRAKEIPYDNFLKAWKKTNYQTLLILPRQ